MSEPQLHLRLGDFFVISFSEELLDAGRKIRKLIVVEVDVVGFLSSFPFGVSQD